MNIRSLVKFEYLVFNIQSILYFFQKYDDMLQMLLDAKEELENEQSNEVHHADHHEDEIDQFGSVTNSELSQRTKYKSMLIYD